MFRSFKSVLFSLLMLAVMSSCEKERSEEVGDGLNTGGSQSGTAEWTLDGAPVLCTTPLISGDYIVGRPLDISNSVVITATVTVPGTYVISTGLINGIQFSGSGTFAATGTQTITLFGSGTPAVATTANYSPGIDGCTFLITAITSTVTPVSGLLYQANIDGIDYEAEATSSSGYVAGTSISVSGDDATLVSTIGSTAAGATAFNLQKGILRSYSSVSNLTFSSFFAPGSYPFDVSPDDGIRIAWTDQAGNVWATNKGSGDQTGSLFTINSVNDEPGQADYTVRVVASFNCKLYDDSGNQVTLIDGIYVGLFSKL